MKSDFISGRVNLSSTSQNLVDRKNVEVVQVQEETLLLARSRGKHDVLKFP